MKSLILDIDGVIIRDKNLLDHVKNNCVNYVKLKLPGARDPVKVNHLLMKDFGHTGIGLRKSFNVNADDFNEHVYTPELIHHLHEVIKSSDFNETASIINEIAERRWQVQLFTNAPEIWAKPIADAMSDEISYTCAKITHPKPNSVAYTGFSTVKTHVFIDDRVENLKAAKNFPNWYPVHFTDDPTPTWYPTVKSFKDIRALLCGIDLKVLNWTAV